jgi:hypothetical protein
MRDESDLDLHIHQIEERLAARRARLGQDVEEIGGATRSLVVSPGVLSAAAGLGFFLARATSRKPVAPRRTKMSGLLGFASGIGMTLLKMRYGDPSAWIGKFLAGGPPRRTQG